VLLGLGILVNYVDRVALSVAQDPLHAEFGIGPAEFGLLSGTFFWVYAICQIPVGFVLDRFGYVVVGRTGAFLWGLAASATALAPNFTVLNAARGFLGIAEAPAFPGNAKATSYWFPTSERGLATAIFDAAAKASNVIAVPLLAFIVGMAGWRWGFGFTALLSFLFFLLFTRFYRNPSQMRSLPKEEYDYIVCGGAQPEGVPANREFVQLAYLVSQAKVWGLTIGFSAYGYLFGLLLTWLPGYLKATFHESLVGSAGYAAIPWAVATVSDLVVGGWLVDTLIARGHEATRVRKTILVLGMVLGLAIFGATLTNDIRLDRARRRGVLGTGGLVDPRTHRAARQRRRRRQRHELFQQPGKRGRADCDGLHRRKDRIVSVRAGYGGRRTRSRDRLVRVLAWADRTDPRAGVAAMASRPVLVGVDIGTSAVKVLACTLEGRSVASASASYRLSTPRPGFVEQDAEEVYRATVHALQSALAEVHLRGDEALAVGFSSAMHALLAVDERGEPLAPLITWMDRRSAPVAERWCADGTADTLYARTGAPVHPMLPSCKLRWLHENDLGLCRRTRRFIGMKELLVFRLTGKWLIDWGIASASGLFDAAHRQWDPYALDQAAADPAKLSEPVATSRVERDLRSPAAQTLGLHESALVLASSDGALANLGVGAVEAGELALTLGTSGAIRVVVDSPALDPHGRTFCYAFDDTRYIAGGPTSSAGAVLNKIFELVLGETATTERFNKALELADSGVEGANGLVLLPFLSGERAPYWLSELRGAFVGLDLAHTRADIFRAAFESVVFALASVLEVLRERVGQPQRVRLSGGLTHAPLVRRLVADVFGCEAVLSDQEEASAFGAAMMAGVAIGAIPDIRAVANLLHPVEVQQPDPRRVEQYREIFARYRQCVDAVVPLFADRAQAG